MEQALGVALLWLACLHHILELVLHEALTQKLGPTSGPTEKYFARFESYFNSLKKEEVEEIRMAATARLELLSPEDEVTAEFFESSSLLYEIHERIQWLPDRRLWRICPLDHGEDDEGFLKIIYPSNHSDSIVIL